MDDHTIKIDKKKQSYNQQHEINSERCTFVAKKTLNTCRLDKLCLQSKCI